MDERADDHLSMDRRRFLLAALGGAGALAVGGCSPKPTRKATLRLHIGAFGFPTPFAANAGPGYNQMSLLYDSLLWKDGNGQLLPWLARSSTTSEDHLTHTFELRDGVRWSDGRPLTAEDVVFTFDYYAKQGSLLPPILVQPPQGIAKVTATAPSTVEVVLEKPTVTFAGQVAGALPIIPKHVWSGVDDPAARQDREVLVGSGGYRLSSYKGDGEALQFAARDGYFLGTPFIRQIDFNGISDEAKLNAMISGAVDATSGSGLRPDALARFTKDPAIGIITQRHANSMCLYWNLGRRGALGDPTFRRACAMAIDRKDLVTQLAGGNGDPGNPGFLGPDNPFFTPVEQHDLDIAGANALLDGAGYKQAGNGERQAPGGAPLSFELLASNGDAPLADLLALALTRIGVQLRARRVEVGPLLFGPKLLNGYDMAVLPYPGPSAGGPNGDPDVLRQLFSSASPPSLTGASGYRSPAFDELAEKQRSTFDDIERKALVAQMQRLLAEDLPVLPLYYPQTVLLFRRSVLDQWYFTPGQFPTSDNNKQLFITGQRSGTEIRRR